ncbi:glycosyltransferase [Candidatus Parcubacteria bacterium]|jgi:glycosyltransferase involved in cell wall biosynthesis|nr:glycosyltransferase [Candidatus Parcubacteria bacterium]
MSEKINQEISIVIPLFNEKGSLQELNDKLVDVLTGLNLTYEIVYIDDGSDDGSLDILKQLKVSNQQIKVISLRRNFGKSAALAIGFQECQGDLVVTMDADLQDDPNEIPNLIAKINKGYDLVSGWKKDRKDPLVKLISSKIFNITVASMTGIKLHDFNCGFKIYKKEVVKNINVYGELHRFLPALAHQQGFKVTEVVVKHHARKFDESKYGNLGLGRFTNYLLDPINVILLTKYARKPAHFFGNLGLMFFLLGSGLCLYLTIVWFQGQAIGSRPLLFLGVLFIIIGIQLISMGFLGEIIVRQADKKETRHYIKKII